MIHKTPKNLKDKRKFSNQNKKVNTFVVILSSIFVIFLLFVGLDIIGLVNISQIFNYSPRLYSQSQNKVLLQSKKEKEFMNYKEDIDFNHKVQDSVQLQSVQFDKLSENYDQVRDTAVVDMNQIQNNDNSLVGQITSRKILLEQGNSEAQISIKGTSIQETTSQQQQRIITGDLIDKGLKIEINSQSTTYQANNIENQSQDYLQPTYQIADDISLISNSKTSVSEKQHKKKNAKRKYKGVSKQSQIKFANSGPKQQLNNIEKPLIDQNEYLYFELPNKLKVVLVYDENLTLAEAALNVQVGSWHEPTEFPGLAHFLEHMLFQGSEKYPGMGKFDDLVSNSGGYSNAYTEQTNTNYFFAIDQNRLKNALQVFANFFIDPTFDQNAVSLEVNAVNSEYETAVSDDDWRLDSLLIILADKSHPNSRFNMGSKESLMKNGLVEALKSFFENNYSSNLMSLAIKSNVKNNKMRKWVEQISDFKLILNKEIQFQDFSELAMPIKQKLPLLIKMNQNSQEKSIILIYQIPALKNQKETKPLDFITYFITSSHTGGLKNYLINQQGFLLDIDAYIHSEGAAYHNYIIQMELPTDNKYDFGQKQLAIRLAKVCSNYFQKMKEQFFDPNNEPTQYLIDTYNQQSVLSQINFKYMENDEYSSVNEIYLISESMSNNKVEKILSSDYLLEQFDSQLIKQYLDNLNDLNNLMIVIADNEYVYKANSQAPPQQDVIELTQIQKGSATADLKFINNNQLNEYDPIYRLSYGLKYLKEQSKEFIFKQDSNIINNFELPPLNQYLPDEFELATICQKQGLEYIVNLPQVNQINDDPYLYLDQSDAVMINQNQSSEDNKQLSAYQIPSVNELSSSMEIRQQMFIQSSVPMVFQSLEDCVLNEFSYERENKFPQLLKKDISGKIWWKLNRAFKIPSVFVALKFETAMDLNSLNSQTTLSLFNLYLVDKLREELEQAVQIGYEIDFETGDKGISVQIYGFSSKIKDFLKKLLNCMSPNRKKGFLQLSSTQRDETDQKRFIRAKDRLSNELKNIYEVKLHEQLSETYLPMIMSQPFYQPQDQLKELELLKLDDLDSIQGKIFSNFRYNSLFVGNLLKEDVHEIVNEMESVLSQSTSDVQSSQYISQVFNLLSLNIIYPIYSLSSDQNDQNGATLNFYQMHKRNVNSYSIMQLLSNTFQNKAFKYLRTERQLGYTVTASFRSIGCIDGAQIIVQGDSQLPNQINKHIEGFLQVFGTYLEQMTQKQLQVLKEGVLANLNDKISSLKEEGQFLWNHIEFGDLAFDESQNRGFGYLYGRKLLTSTIQCSRMRSVENLVSNFMGLKQLQYNRKGMLQKQLNIQNKEDFINILSQSSNGLSTKESYASLEEKIVFNSQQFGSYVDSAFNCDYLISNI